jgi:16S rRNA U516 pseudouridylate synthase RsuA-like enzyme
MAQKKSLAVKQSMQERGMVRLNKHLAQLGIASRRKIDELIERNQVWVNDKRAGLGMKINPAADTIRIGKKEIAPSAINTRELEYWLVYKPPGMSVRRMIPTGAEPLSRLSKAASGYFQSADWMWNRKV